MISQPRRIAFGRGPLPEGSELELHSGPLREELEQLAAEGVQSLLLEGGPDARRSVPRGRARGQAARVRRTRISGDGPGMLEGLPRPLELSRLEARPIGEDVLLQAYLNEP